MSRNFDVIVVGGGHNGLVAAGYLSGAGLRVLVLEGRPALGGPAGRYEFMPGYFGSVTNSPGSLEPKVTRDLELEQHGLSFFRPACSLVHPFEDGRAFVAWRDKARTSALFESYRTGESDRYDRFHRYLGAFAERLGISLFAPPPTLNELVANLHTDADQEAFSRIMFGSASELFEEFELAEQIKAILGPLSVVSGQAAPSTPGTPLNLLMRPLSLASETFEGEYDPRRMTLRGSTGLPVGGMPAVVDALVSSVRSRGGTIESGVGVDRIRTRSGAVSGVVTAHGEEIDAPIVISAVSPKATVLNLLDDDRDDWRDIKAKLCRKRITGKAFKVVLALDELPRYAAASSVEEATQMAQAQFRIAPTLRYLDEAHMDMMLGRVPTRPVIWGLCPTATSPTLAPEGRHLLSLNIGNAPYKLMDSDWETERGPLLDNVVKTLTEWMPNLSDTIVDAMCIDPTEIEAEFGLPESNITYGDLLPSAQFWMRPMTGIHRYATPTRGLYLSGAGTWPGNFVSGIPGHNTSRAVLVDLKAEHISVA